MRAPVVSVGNLALGGRGKTPTTALVASLLVEAGERPAIISRGYKRQQHEDGAIIVSDGERQLADVTRAGDEPVMLSRRVPGAAVVVSDVRAIGAAFAESALGATVHVLDDGFQHRSMRRDIDLVLVTPKDLLDRRLPFGRLRSPVRALASADAVIVDEGTIAEVEARLAPVVDRRKVRLFVLERRLGKPRWLQTPLGIARHDEVPPGARVVAAAGIARPRRFADSLQAQGFDVADVVQFPDHHVFSRADLERLEAAIQRTGAEFVATTEKDAIRWLPLRPLGVPMAVAPLEVAVQPESDFKDWLLSRLAEVRACRH